MCYLMPGQFADEEARFRVQDWLGFGGVVPHFELFSAEDRRTGELVRVKVFSTVDWFESPAGCDIDRVRALEHETLIAPIDFGPVPGDSVPFYGGPLMYVAEPYLAGRSLEALLDEDPPAERVRPVADSLVDGFRYLAREWRLCDIPPREIVIVGRSQARWSLIGAPTCDPEGVPNVLRSMSRLYPELVPEPALES